MAITNRNQMIDTVTISKGCDIIEQAVQDYVKCAKFVQEAASTCTGEALSVEKKTMQPTLEELAGSIKTIPGQVEKITTEIRAAALRIYSKQEEQYEAYLAELEAQKNAASSN